MYKKNGLVGLIMAFLCMWVVGCGMPGTRYISWEKQQNGTEKFSWASGTDLEGLHVTASRPDGTYIKIDVDVSDASTPLTAEGVILNQLFDKILSKIPL